MNPEPIFIVLCGILAGFVIGHLISGGGPSRGLRFRWLVVRFIIGPAVGGATAWLTLYFSQ